MKFISVCLILILSLCLGGIQGFEGGIFTCENGVPKGASSITFQSSRVTGIIAGFSCFESKKNQTVFTYPPYSFTTIPRTVMDGTKFEGSAVVLDFKNILNTYFFDYATITYVPYTGETVVVLNNPRVVLNTLDPNKQ
ncbi:expressed protein [Dictyostelium purpureum]|uniref:Expressed protein n=1 Tax=Dictyostelium purpureum TaxID=5786 RepID=F0ZKK9_DICPU|nr:uncharacterized protein DICPUDRAFT_92012 [Dictyostelium purpureum]EGC35519.1 expressed protein [Dictyostelium purpureum]|eukprot:XP_003287945.1 expressed protein [Dictyostelium purpureum]